MIYLAKVSEFKQRMLDVRAEVGQYWLDRLVMQAQARRRQELVVTGQVLALLRQPELGMEIAIPGLNIVTDIGDEFYAYRGSNVQPPDGYFTDGATLPFDGIMELYNGASAAPDKANDRSDLAGLVTGSGQAMDSGYPKRDDDDTDNTGAGVDIVTYRRSYTTAQANATGIADVVITNPSPGASEVLLMHAEFAATFDKTSSDTLKVFVNHSFLGV